MSNQTVEKSRNLVLEELIKNGELNENDINKEFKMTNKDAFKVLYITDTKINDIPWQIPNYLNAVMNRVNSEEIETKPESFIEVIYNKLNLNKNGSSDVNTSLIYESEEFVYEMMYVDYEDGYYPENDNEIGTLINTKGEMVFGNILVTKTFIDPESNEMKFLDMTLKDLFVMLELRSDHVGVILDDGELVEYKWKGDKEHLKDTLDDIFEGEYPKHKEYPFLLHNLNIYYTKGVDNSLKKLIGEPFDKCFFMTYLTNDFISSISKKEVKKIIKLSNVLTSWQPDKELMEEETDELGRKIIKNKYRILNRTVEKNKISI